jgi:hypothetical protein
MMSYRDMTFCTHYQDCDKASTCHRPLTPEVLQQARAWWGSADVPICQYVIKPPCHSDFENERSEIENGGSE